MRIDDICSGNNIQHRGWGIDNNYFSVIQSWKAQCVILGIEVEDALTMAEQIDL